MRILIGASVLICLCADAAYAQAPATGPLVLTLPASNRAAALGNAWVAGRDAEVVFYNPAQLIGARQEFSLSLFRPGPAATGASFASAYAAGRWSLTLGWGVQIMDFSADAGTPYPFTSDVLLSTGSTSGLTSLVTVGGAIVYKGFRIGAAGKVASDRVSPESGAGSAPVEQHAFLADIGVARNLLGGVGALAVQNLGRTSVDGASPHTIPRQVLLGWSTTKQAGSLDLGVFTQVTVRHDWTSAGAGLDVGYSWIEGYSVAFRIGARRPEAAAEHPLALGAAFTADRITIEYAAQFFEGGRSANGVTIRWR